MSAPPITAEIEPATAGGAVSFLPLAPARRGEDGVGQVSLRLDVTNHHPRSRPVRLTRVVVSFDDRRAGETEFAADLPIGAAAPERWWFDRDDVGPAAIFVPLPAPETVTVSLFCDGFDEPHVERRSLVPHVSPVERGSYLFPARAADLGEGEYWWYRGEHADGPAGDQLFGYDLKVVRFDEDAREWTHVRKGGDPGVNEDHLAWGKPIYAMADGFVRAIHDSQPTNPSPPADLSGEGNHFWIDHDGERVKYTHLQMGTLNPDLRRGDEVRAGDFLGLAGNSGNSDKPHLHIHAIRERDPLLLLPRPIPFRRLLTVAADPAPPAEDGWLSVSGEGLPREKSLVWPGFPRVRRVRPPISFEEELTVDPLALLFPAQVYVRLTLPDPPPLEVLRRAAREHVRGLSPAQRRAALARLEALGGSLDVLREELRRPPGG